MINKSTSNNMHHHFRISMRYWYLASFAILIVGFCRLTQFWLTNDDVGLAMIANGYGTAASPTPTLVFSNIAWGYLINWFPNIAGIQSYTWITYIALTLAYLVIAWSLFRNNVHPFLGSTLVLLLFLPVVIYPQFTLISGYLACAGVSLVFVQNHGHQGLSALLAACLLVLSGLVRLQELLLVFIVALPVLIGQWRRIGNLKLKRLWLIAAIIVISVLSLFQILDKESYKNSAWQVFNSTNHLRAEFTDFNLSRFYYQNPDEMQGTGYSKNDIEMFNNWFFVDPAVFSSTKISRLIRDVPLSGRIRTNLRLATIFWRPFHDVLILCLISVIGILLIFHRRRRYILSSMMTLVFVMGLLVLLGRGGVTRIYIPTFALLALLTALQPVTSSGQLLKYYAVVGAATLVAVLIMLTTLISKNADDRSVAEQVHAATCQVPNDSLVIIWGSAFPYTDQYQPFRKLNSPCQLKIYSLGAFGVAPFELDQLYADTGYHDLVTAILAGQSFNFIASYHDMAMLQKYFTEHYKTELVVKHTMKSRYFDLYNVSRMKSDRKSGQST